MARSKKREVVRIERSLPKRRAPHRPTRRHEDKTKYKRSREKQRQHREG